ncbi:MAG: hypothetical protein RIT51_451 [Actinomycetota bacterium]|jgi:hypothetical protein
MRLSQFNELMTDEFGAEYAAVLRRDLVLGELADQTADKAIAGGEDPKVVWLALCKAAGVPKERWHGLNKNSKKDTPK